MNNPKILTETVIRLCDAKARFQSEPTVWTVRNWAEKGRRSVSGKVVTLEWVLIGGIRHTSVEACKRFTERLNSYETENPENGEAHE